ncbi:MAG: DNA mismatch repair protein MutL, partial [Hallella bergensis]
SNLGGGMYALNAVPEGLEGVDVFRLMHDMLLSAEDSGTPETHEINISLALSLARAAAIPYGQVLSNAEMENVINGLFLCSNVNYTPDGKNILYILKQVEIEQMLK